MTGRIESAVGGESERSSLGYVDEKCLESNATCSEDDDLTYILDREGSVIDG